jgi:hypothetical protein
MLVLLLLLWHSSLVTRSVADSPEAESEESKIENSDPFHNTILQRLDEQVFTS